MTTYCKSLTSLSILKSDSLTDDAVMAFVSHYRQLLHISFRFIVGSLWSLLADGRIAQIPGHFEGFRRCFSDIPCGNRPSLKKVSLARAHHGSCGTWRPVSFIWPCGGGCRAERGCFWPRTARTPNFASMPCTIVEFGAPTLGLARPHVNATEGMPCTQCARSAKFWIQAPFGYQPSPTR